jgi:DNA-binding XRE family transcriptional regulator
VPGGKRASPPGKRGRKPHAPTPEQRKLVEELSAVGLKQADVARLVGVSITTLVAYYRDELDTGGLKANAAVAKSLFRMATAANKPNVAAAIFWLKVRAGWREDDKGFWLDIVEQLKSMMPKDAIDAAERKQAQIDR